MHVINSLHIMLCIAEMVIVDYPPSVRLSIFEKFTLPMLLLCTDSAVLLSVFSSILSLLKETLDRQVCTQTNWINYQ